MGVVMARLRALTAEARAALGRDSVLIEHWPYRIGRWSSGGESKNLDLALVDQQPYRVSRDHLLLRLEHGQVAVYDQGSRLGSWMGGQALGGRQRFRGPVHVGEQGLDVVLGGPQSPLRYALQPLSAAGGGRD